jgi:FixJ family two-component response regulator
MGDMPKGLQPMNSLVSIVDDNWFFLDSMQRLMDALGYTVETFSSASEFLSSPRLVDTACLIADVHMPAMSGVELYRYLLQEGYPIRIVLVTAYPNDVDRAHAMNDGVVCYLRKPIDEEHLLRCLRAALPTTQPPEGPP